jgi:hypothetical protein
VLHHQLPFHVKLGISVMGVPTWMVINFLVVSSTAFQSVVTSVTVAGADDSSSPRLALDGGTLWAAWDDDRSGALDVFVNGGVLPE